MKVIYGLALIAVAVVIQPTIVAGNPMRLGLLFRQLKPPDRPEYWWSEVAIKYWRRAWTFTTAIVLTVVGVMIASDAEKVDGIGWVRSVWSLLALLLGLIGLGSLAEMGFVLRRLTRQDNWPLRRPDLWEFWLVGLFCVCVAYIGVAWVANAIV